MLKPSPLVFLLAVAAVSHAAPQLVFQAQPVYLAQPGAASFYPLGSHVLLLPPRHDENVGEAPEPPPAAPGFWGQIFNFFRPPPDTPVVAPAEPPNPPPAEPQNPPPAEPQNPPPADVQIPVVLPAELTAAAVVAEEPPATEGGPEDSTEKLAAIAKPDREPLETPDAGPAPEPEVGVRPDATRRFPPQFFGSYDFLRSKDALLLLHQGSPVQGVSPWYDARRSPPAHVVTNHVLPSHVLPSHVVNVGPRYETVYLVRREGDDVAIIAPTTVKPVTKPPGDNSTDDEQAGPSVAQAKPQAIAVAGVGGVAAANPVATALVGPGGLAVAAPSATAIAGQTQGQITAPALAAAAAAAHKLRAPMGVPKKVAGYDEDEY